MNAVKKMQRTNLMSAEDAAASIIREPAQKLAKELDAQLLGEKSGTSTFSREATFDKLKSSLESRYPFGDDRTAVAGVLAKDVRYYDLPEMLENLKTLRHFVDERTNGKALYISENVKSQALMKYLYQQVNGIDESQFVTTEELKKLSSTQLEGKTLVLLDDASYNGSQLLDKESKIQKIAPYNRVIAANLVTHKRAYLAMENSGGPEIATLESMTPFLEENTTRTETIGRKNGIAGATRISNDDANLTPAQAEARRLYSFYEFNRGNVFGKVGNRLVFFFKQADSTPKFIENILKEHFNIKV